MKLGSIFQDTDFDKMFEVLVANYDDAEKNKLGYKKAFDTVKKMRISNKKEVDFEIHIVKNKYGKEEKDYFYVYGKDKKNKKDYGLDFTNWKDWLAADVCAKTLKEYHYKDIAAHSLWEMTYHGYSNKDTVKFVKEIKERVEEIK